MSGCHLKNIDEILLLFSDAMDGLMHGNILGENDEESAICRGEEL